MNNKIILLLVVILFAGSYFVGQWLRRDDMEKELPSRQMRYAACDPVMDDCVAFIDSHKLVIRFLQPPSALKPFGVQLVADTINPQSIVVEFSMRGMDMGMNRYSLQPLDGGAWATQVTLPVCSLGRHDWDSRFEVVYQGNRWFANFSFVQATGSARH
jgi:hypothetical protein